MKCDRVGSRFLRYQLNYLNFSFLGFLIIMSCRFLEHTFCFHAGRSLALMIWDMGPVLLLVYFNVFEQLSINQCYNKITTSVDRIVDYRRGLSGRAVNYSVF